MMFILGSFSGGGSLCDLVGFGSIFGGLLGGLLGAFGELFLKVFRRGVLSASGPPFGAVSGVGKGAFLGFFGRRGRRRGAWYLQ